MTRRLIAILMAGALSIAARHAPLLAQGTREGIVVHGDWVIEVRNPDGSLAERREFKNGLTGAATALSIVLANEYTVDPRGFWRIMLFGSTAGSDQPAAPASPFRLGGTPVPASIVRPGDTLFPYKLIPELERPARVSPPGGGPYNQVLLTGIAKADAKGSIARVETNVGLCNDANCSSPAPYNFTGTDLKVGGQLAPLPLEAGQIVQVTVRISFSSGS